MLFRSSALSIGLTPFQAFRYVIFPQAFAIATPAIGANCLFLMKETSVISAVAVAELMFVAKEVIGLCLLYTSSHKNKSVQNQGA